jgi:spore maturation protein CgeB
VADERPVTYGNLKAIVLADTWLGSTGRAALDAFLRAGVRASAATEGLFIPLRWRGPMRAMGRAVRPLAVRQFNEFLVREAERLRPDLFLAVKGTFVQAETLRTLGRLGTRRYCFYPDVSFLSHGPYLSAALREYDWIFTTKRFGLADLQTYLGVSRASYLPHAFDPVVHRPLTPSLDDQRRFSCDASFVGAFSPKKAALLEALARRRPDIQLRVWGPLWDRVDRGSPLASRIMGQVITGFEYAMAISCSRVNLGLLSEAVGGASSGDRITSRTFHIPACGGLLLHERTDELLEVFAEGESCACFEGPDELVTQVEGLLRDEPRRATIARRGRAVVSGAHSWDDRARTILDHHVHATSGLPRAGS